MVTRTEIINGVFSVSVQFPTGISRSKENVRRISSSQIAAGAAITCVGHRGISSVGSRVSIRRAKENRNRSSGCDSLPHFPAVYCVIPVTSEVLRAD